MDVFDEESLQLPDRNKLIDSVRTQIPGEQERRKRPPRHVASLAPQQAKMHEELEKLRQEGYAKKKR